jgi:hypothetical protein
MSRRFVVRAKSRIRGHGRLFGGIAVNASDLVKGPSSSTRRMAARPPASTSSSKASSTVLVATTERC